MFAHQILRTPPPDTARKTSFSDAPGIFVRTRLMRESGMPELIDNAVGRDQGIKSCVRCLSGRGFVFVTARRRVIFHFLRQLLAAKFCDFAGHLR